jgi:hypothetical protein
MSEDEDITIVRVTGREIYDKLSAVHADLQEVKRSTTLSAEIQREHSQRLTALERWRYSAGAALLTAVVSMGVTIARSIGAAQ